jgi:hypothetical protein
LCPDIIEAIILYFSFSAGMSLSFHPEVVVNVSQQSRKINSLKDMFLSPLNVVVGIITEVPANRKETHFPPVKTAVCLNPNFY